MPYVRASRSLTLATITALTALGTSPAAAETPPYCWYNDADGDSYDVPCSDPRGVFCNSYGPAGEQLCASYGYPLHGCYTGQFGDRICQYYPRPTGPTPTPTSTPTPSPTPAPCTFNGQPVPHGSGVTAYLSDQVPNGQSCQSETRTCTNGILSGSYAFPACTVASVPDNDLPF